MYTQCPDCSTAFRVSAEVLKQAAGKVRCGGCGNAFNALDYLSEQKPAPRVSAEPEPSLPELKPDPPAQENKLPKSISAEQSAALLKTLDDLAGSDIRIEDTGVEWRVFDDDEEEIDDVVDTRESAIDEILEDSPTPVDQFLTATPNDVEAAEVFEESANALGRTPVDELRFDDNTPLPDDFDLDDESSYVPEAPKLEEPPAEEPVAEDVQPQADLDLSEPDEWEDILGEFDDLAKPAPTAPLEAELAALETTPEEPAEDHGEPGEGHPPPGKDQELLDMDTQFALQAEAMGIDLSGMHEGLEAKAGSEDGAEELEETPVVLHDDEPEPEPAEELIEEPIELVVEESIEEPDDLVVEEAAEAADDLAIEEPAEAADDLVIEELAEVADDLAIEEPAEAADDLVVEEPVDEPDESLVQESIDELDKIFAEQPTDKPDGESDDGPIDEPDDEPAIAADDDSAQLDLIEDEAPLEFGAVERELADLEDQSDVFDSSFFNAADEAAAGIEEDALDLDAELDLDEDVDLEAQPDLKEELNLDTDPYPEDELQLEPQAIEATAGAGEDSPADEHDVPPMSEEEQTINMMIDQDLLSLAVEDEDGFASTIVMPEKDEGKKGKKRKKDKKGKKKDKQKSEEKDIFESSGQGFETIIMEGEHIRTTDDEIKLEAHAAEAAQLVAQSKAEEAAVEAASKGKRVRMISGIVALVLVLAIQVLHQSREALATIPFFNDIVGPVYRAIGKPLSPAWDITGWRIEATKGSIEEDDEKLVVYSRIGNKSDSPLPYPIINISLTDRFEETLGSRQLDPAEYLPDNLDPSKLVQPGENFNAVISIQSPSADASGYELDVCYRVSDGQLRCAIADFK